ncbi:MAG: FlgB family protein [Cypionkella sp.]|nr:FlgB family protein [Cypionkella sp.]
MLEKLELTRMAQALASHAGARMGVIAQNVAHADTPGYRAADVASFAESYADQGRQMDLRTTRAGHFPSDNTGEAPPLELRRKSLAGAPNGNSVSVEQEMVKSAAARQDHEMALAIYRNTSAIIRASLGRKG